MGLVWVMHGLVLYAFPPFKLGQIDLFEPIVIRGCFSLRQKNNLCKIVHCSEKCIQQLKNDQLTIR